MSKWCLCIFLTFDLGAEDWVCVQGRRMLPPQVMQVWEVYPLPSYAFLKNEAISGSQIRNGHVSCVACDFCSLFMFWLFWVWERRNSANGGAICSWDNCASGPPPNSYTWCCHYSSLYMHRLRIELLTLESRLDNSSLKYYVAQPPTLRALPKHHTKI